MARGNGTGGAVDGIVRPRGAGGSPYESGRSNADTGRLLLRRQHQEASHWVHARNRPPPAAPVFSYCASGGRVMGGDSPAAVQSVHGHECAALDAINVHFWQKRTLSLKTILR